MNDPLFKYTNFYHHLSFENNIDNLKFMLIPSAKKLLQAIIIVLF